MLRRRRIRLAVGLLASVVAGAVAVTPARGWAASAPAAGRPDDASEAEALLAQADRDRAAGRWAEAAAAFDRAYRRLPRALLGELGPPTVLLAVEAYERDAHTAGEGSIRAALSLLDLYDDDRVALGEAAGTPSSIADARARLEDALPDPQPEPQPVVTPPPVTPPPPAAADRDVLGWSLVGVGAAAVVGGIATLAWGSRILPIARDRLEERGRDLMNPAADDAYILEHRRRGRIVMGVGGVLALAGAAVVVVGAVRVAKRRSRGSDHAGLDFGPSGAVLRF